MKSIKKILSLLMILALSLAMSLALVSCGDEGENNGENGENPGGETTYTYTVTVIGSDNKAVEGAEVELLLEGVAPVGKAVTTDANGKAVFTMKSEGDYYAKVKSASDRYVLSTTPTKLSDNKATVTLSMLPEYMVYVVDEDGNAVSGVAVQICSMSGACQLPKLTDEEGKIVSILAEDSYKACIVSAPDEYVFSNQDYFYLVDGKVTIVLEKK